MNHPARCLLRVLIFMVVCTGAVHAQPSGAPHRKRPNEPGFKSGASDEARSLPLPRPFLMAGDERFEEMLRLVLVPEDQLDAALNLWKDKRELDESAEKIMRRRLESFRRRLRGVALQEAERINLKLTEDQQNEFIRDYWTRRAAVERSIRLKAEKELEHELELLHTKLKKEWQNPR